jgi:outer membrane protein OmpA-like peptidoglycan-associated protein
MEVLLVGLAALALYFATPPQPEELVVLLPGHDGYHGAVVIERGGKRTVLDQPYASNLVVGKREVESPQISAAEVKQSFSAVMDALPPRPASYLLYFVTGTDELTDESKAHMQRVLEELRARQMTDMVLIGHTDTVGTLEANDELSLQRAERMRADLIQQGFAAERIHAAGRGEREPLVPTGDGVEESRNRRVEISIRR